MLGTIESNKQAVTTELRGMFSLFNMLDMLCTYTHTNTIVYFSMCFEANLHFK